MAKNTMRILELELPIRIGHLGDYRMLMPLKMKILKPLKFVHLPVRRRKTILLNLTRQRKLCDFMSYIHYDILLVKSNNLHLKRCKNVIDFTPFKV